ncbi:hypothetical protein [Bifidobacterium aquikefiri]
MTIVKSSECDSQDRAGADAVGGQPLDGSSTALFYAKGVLIDS